MKVSKIWILSIYRIIHIYIYNIYLVRFLFFENQIHTRGIYLREREREKELPNFGNEKKKNQKKSHEAYNTGSYKKINENFFVYVHE